MTGQGKEIKRYASAFTYKICLLELARNAMVLCHCSAAGRFSYMTLSRPCLYNTLAEPRSGTTLSPTVLHFLGSITLGPGAALF
jgi:hypothetical protein